MLQVARLVGFTSLLIFTIISTLMVETSRNMSQRAAQSCFAETGFCIEGRIREFWEQNGGLPVFGFPVTQERPEVVEGQQVTAQWFERSRLEWHWRNARPYDVLLGRLGVEQLIRQGGDWTEFPKSAPQPNCRFFSETRHNVCGDILKVWRASGLEFDGKKGKSEAESLALFGLPISEPHVEDTSNGKFTVQQFERARFELHPENQPPYHVLLGLLGKEIIARAGSGTLKNRDVAPGGVPALVNVVPPSWRPIDLKPGDDIRIGKVDIPASVDIGFSGFVPNQDIIVETIRPDGTTLQRDTTRSDLRWFWSLPQGEPLGEYIIKVTQGSFQAKVTLTVVILPRIQGHPETGTPGTTFQIIFTDFQSYESVPVTLYYRDRCGDSWCWIYATSLPPAQMDEYGGTTYLLYTQPDDPLYQYLVAVGTVQYAYSSYRDRTIFLFELHP